ncbi:lysosomal Pro-X carboxypeptidase [Drosophila grimshawi]|uniref:Lysosomal Pro-X carboxypeptidase n=1 Tax=Drosophila grimshawi TaxID=7222 RepID=B4K2R1_DROGR|nr:lysosomal Pro-X carboxypeptidase [Drosophila grimshawi]EDW04971.1 GH13951 [Drosophila grimshawi]
MYVYICALLFSSLLLATSAQSKFEYEIKEFQVPLDHFSFLSNASFSIRYLYNESYADKSNPKSIFFYTGNEGDIEWFAKNSGFVWELAEKERAIVVFAEHRYYGKSLPFGSDTFNASKPEHLAYFTVEQTLEDYAMLITFLRNGRQLPVVAFGGSYGGMLAAWFRIKYPHIVVGALAASAPILQFEGLTPCDIFNEITTSVFNTAYNANCSANIGKSWHAFETMAATDAGKKQLGDKFHLCEPIKNGDDLNQFMDYLEDVYANLAMSNYPYNTNFLAPLPANPVRQFCLYLKDLHADEADLVSSMASALAVYTNYSGSDPCVDYKNSNASSATVDSSGWEIQSCNQMVMPFCANSSNTMYRTSTWDLKKVSDKCYKKFQLTPKPFDIVLRYGGRDLVAASNIIFSNGLLDPWSGGGVLMSPNDRIHIIILPEGAHHLDLRQSNPMDPASVVDARQKEAAIIGQWISEFYRYL